MSLRIASRSLGMYHAIEKKFFEGPVVLWVSVGLNCYRYALWGLFFFGCCLSRQAESTVLIGCIASSLEKKNPTRARTNWSKKRAFKEFNTNEYFFQLLLVALPRSALLSPVLRK